MHTFSTPDSPRGLAAGTLVTTPDGDKKIEEIKAGDLVLSGVGEDKTFFFEVAKVSAKPYCGPVLQVTANISKFNSDYQLRVTPNYICFGATPREPFLRNTPLFTDEDVLLYAYMRYEHELGKVGHFITRRKDDGIERFNNLDLAGETARRISQANGGAEIKRFACFSQVVTFDFMPASDLKVTTEIPALVGDLVKYASIANITEEQYDGLIYNLDIPETRNFAANGVLVHDSRS